MFEKKERKTKEDYLISFASILFGLFLMFILKDSDTEGTFGGFLAFVGIVLGFFMIVFGVISIFIKK